ncbi:MAG: outer membrane beta-barrel protein [Planctomycetota bacterium]
MFIRAIVLLLAGLLILSGSVLAQDAPPAADEGMDAGAEEGAGEPLAESADPIEKDPVEGEEEPGEGVEEAIRRVPTFEDTNPEYMGDEPPLFEDFIGLAQDFVYRAALGPVSFGRVPVWPRGNLKLGPILIFPYLDGRVGWTSNVYQDRSEVSSFFLAGGGGISVNYPFKQGRGKIFGGADYQATTYPDESLSYAEWTLSAGIGYRFDRGFWFRTGVRHSRTVDPQDPEEVGLQKRNQTYPFIDLGFDNAIVKDLNISMGFNVRTTWYVEEENETGDRDEYNAWIKASYPVYRDKTRGYLRYDHRWTVAGSDRINDSNGGELSGGIEGIIPLTESEKLVGMLSIGVRNTNFQTGNYDDNGSSFDTDDNDQKAIVTMRALLRYLASAKTTVEIVYLRDMEYSSFSNYQVVDRFDLIGTHSMYRDLVLRAATYVRFSEPSAVRDSVTEFGAGCGARYILIDNIDLDLSVDWYTRQSGNDLYSYDRVTAALGLTLYFR